MLPLPPTGPSPVEKVLMGALLNVKQVAAAAGTADRSITRPAREVLAVPGEAAPIQGAASPVLGLIAPPDGPILTAEGHAEAIRRYHIIEPFLVSPEKFAEFWMEHGHSRGRAIAAVSMQHGIGVRTLNAWRQAFERDGLAGLARKGRTDAGTARVLNKVALEFLISAAFPQSGVYGRLNPAEIFRAFNEEREWRAARAGQRLAGPEKCKYLRYLDVEGRLKSDALLPALSYRTLCRQYDRIPEVARIYAREGIEGFANTQEILSFRALSELAPLDYVVMDHRRLDLFALVPQRGAWKLARPWVTAAIDMRTRKWLAWVIVEVPSSDSIAAVLKRTFLLHGLPKSLYFDNGCDFRCTWFEGGIQTRTAPAIGELSDAWRGVLADLGIRVHHAIVKRARSKIIEPNFLRTSLYDKSTPWWCGNKPSERPEAFETLLKQHEAWMRGERPEPAFLTIQEIAALYNGLMAELNERDLEGQGMQKVTPTGRGWMCPNECWERLIGQVERRYISEEHLQFMFNKRRVLTIRHGEILVSFAGQAFHFRPVDNPLGLMALNGKEVEFAYDPLDLETGVVFFEGRFLSVVSQIALRRMAEKEFIADERDRRAARKTVRKYIDAAHALTPVAGPVERLARRQGICANPVDPATRPEVAAQIPEAIIEAARAVREDKDFSFAAASEVAPDSFAFRLRTPRMAEATTILSFSAGENDEPIAGFPG